jgi:hypothetical protein
MVFSRFLTIFIPAENTQHSEKSEQNSEIECMAMHLNGEDFTQKNKENGKINSLKLF